MEPMTHAYTLSPPPLWKLNEGHPDNIQKIIKALEFFKIHPEWIDNNKEEAKKYFELLECTQLAPDQLSDTDWKAYTTSFLRYPQLFSCKSPDAKVRLVTTNPKQKMDICKNHLLMFSKKFRKELDSKYKEGEKSKIKLETSQYHAVGVKIFLDFISSGQFTSTEEHLVDILFLANEHHIEILEWACLAIIMDRYPDSIIEMLTQDNHPLKSACLTFIQNNFFNLERASKLLKVALEQNLEWIQRKCLAFIKDHINVCFLTDLLQLGLDHKLYELVWICLSFRKTIGSVNDIDLTQCSNEVNEVISILKKVDGFIDCENRMGEVSICNFTPLDTLVKINNIKINKLEDFNLIPSKIMKNFSALNKYIPITSIINGRNDIELETITKSFPHLQKIWINNPNFDLKKESPILKQMEKLEEFYNLGEKEFRSVQEVENYLAELAPIALSALNLTHVKDLMDEALMKLAEKLPKLTHLWLGDQPITSIPFKQLESLRCKGTSLSKVSMPFAKSLEFKDCIYLKAVYAPLALEVDCDACHPDITFNVPASCIFFETPQKVRINQL